MGDIFDDDEDDSWMMEAVPKEMPRKETPPPTQDHLKVLKKSFGHSKFKPLQWDIISGIMADKKDQCVVMATGYGKSLCYQVLKSMQTNFAFANFVSFHFSSLQCFYPRQP